VTRRKRRDEEYDPSADLDRETEMVSLFGPAAGGVVDASWSGLKRLINRLRDRSRDQG
jgi:hypothetical protein